VRSRMSSRSIRCGISRTPERRRRGDDYAHLLACYSRRLRDCRRRNARCFPRCVHRWLRRIGRRPLTRYLDDPPFRNLVTSVRRYSVWILPRWRDPLFLARCLTILCAVSIVGSVSFALHQPLFGSGAFLVCVWPYRHVARVDGAGLHVRWFVFRATIT